MPPLHNNAIAKHLPASIGRRISDISSNKELFNKAKPHYESALKQSGHDEKLTYTERKEPATHTAQPNSRKNRQRNVIWFNPPYRMNELTNIGREFLNLVSKHHRYSKMFNKNNIKVSYSCTDNLQTVIKKHGKKELRALFCCVSFVSFVLFCFFSCVSVFVVFLCLLCFCVCCVSVFSVFCCV